MEAIEVTKGGECWLQMSMNRTSKGLEIRLKALPKLEEFMDTITMGTDPLDSYGGQWKALNLVEGIRVKVLTEPIDENNYAINSPCAPLICIPQGKRNEVPNLSFLKFKGIGSPEGVGFIISGPMSKGYIRGAARKILEASRMFIIDYVAPMSVNLRISSQEL